MPENTYEGIWVDCIVHIIGWFQISAVLNTTSGNYFPETDNNGQPVSGPGWIAYEKPGASPGDIVIIYTLETTGANGAFVPVGWDTSTILWDLINPGGLSYFLEAQHFKVSVNKSDLITALPHAGGTYTPANPHNPFGHQDILWKNVTSYYGIPGPGNLDNPYFVRWAIPSFGVRLIIWTDECCLANAITTLPPAPPIDIPPPWTIDPGAPGPGTPTIGGGEGGGSGSIGMTPQPGQSEGISGLSFGNGRKGDNPSFRTLSPRSSSAFINKVPGTSPKHYNLSSSYQVSLYSAEDHPFGYRYRTGPNDLQVIRRAVPIGLPYQYKANSYIDEHLITKKDDKFIISATPATLASIGIGASTAAVALSATTSRSQPTPNLRGSASQNAPNASGGQSDTVKRTTQYDALEGVPGLPGARVDQRSLGGFNNRRFTTAADVDFDTSKYMANAGVQGRSADVLQKDNYKASKDLKSSSKGNATTNLAGLSQRSIELNASIKNSTFTKGYAQSRQPRFNGINISKASRIRAHGKLQNIKDPNNRFDISFMPLRSVSDAGPPGILSIVRGNVEGAVTVILRQSFFVNSNNSSYGVVLDASPIEFGMVNPPTPGTYVIANPTCLPGQGSLPDIVAGGNTWAFAQLVVTLLTTEGVTIAQSVYTYSPSHQGDTDIIAPNRLPVGLMRDLDINSSANTTYEGTFSQTAANQAEWYKAEPSVIVERTAGNTNSTVSIVLKSTVTALTQVPSFRPLLEIYNDNVLITNDESLSAFVGGPCGALPGWINPSTSTALANGGTHTACLGTAGLGGAGGTSAYIVNSAGIIQSGPYNPGIYAGTHQCFLCFKYNAVNGITDSTYINSDTNYRIRVYNNGPSSSLYGYVLYTSGLKVKAPGNFLSLGSDGYIDGTFTSHHCNQMLKIRNANNGQEVERFSDYINGRIYLGSGSFPGYGANSSLRLQATYGDTIKVFRPGYDNLYSSENLVAEFTI